ncbi:MAG: hypothetical protein GX275_05180 [Clostridiales bacterium]|nr:hypothetical protein [Clostridiales bacterium]
MRQNYNSFKYWESIINENKTIRGHMFMQAPPKEKSVYIHTLIFSKKNGIDNIYTYFPDVKVMLGYIQYSFLQEAFYKWINGKDKVVTKIPYVPLEKIISNGLKKGSISRAEANKMLDYNNKISKMWELPKDRIIPELMKFARSFNKTWFGDNKEFLYLKVFKSPEEVGEFVVNSSLITGDDNIFKERLGVTVNEWRCICKDAIKNETMGERFKEILQKNLTQII